uniref:Uncharacterized protein n=1 Tax=Cyanoderma ruficeps TaxID=181631 RepID=A0A8C3XDD8_9PASS
PAAPLSGPPAPARRTRPPPGLYLVVLPGVRSWLAVAAHHIHEQGVAAQPAQPQSHGEGARSAPRAAAASPLHGSGGSARGPRTRSGRNAPPRQRGPPGRLRCDTPGPGAHLGSLSLGNGRAGPRRVRTGAGPGRAGWRRLGRAPRPGSSFVPAPGTAGSGGGRRPPRQRSGTCSAPPCHPRGLRAGSRGSSDCL